MWIWLSLSSALTLAWRDTYIKLLSRDNPILWITVISQLTSAVLVTLFFQIFGHPDLARFFSGSVIWVWLVLLPLDTMVFILYFRALSFSPLSVCIPFLAFTPVLLPLTSWIFLREAVSLWSFAGLLVVMIGAYTIFYQPGGDFWAPFRALGREKGARNMLLVSLLYSLTGVLGRMLTLRAGPDTTSAFYPLALGLSLLIVALLSRKKETAKLQLRKPALWAGMTLSGGIMVITHFLALSQAHAAYMMSVKRTSIIFSLLFSWIYLREEVRQRVWAVLLMAAGVVMVVLGQFRT